MLITATLLTGIAITAACALLSGDSDDEYDEYEYDDYDSDLEEQAEAARRAEEEKRRERAWQRFSGTVRKTVGRLEAKAEKLGAGTVRFEGLDALKVERMRWSFTSSAAWTEESVRERLVFDRAPLARDRKWEKKRASLRKRILPALERCGQDPVAALADGTCDALRRDLAALAGADPRFRPAGLAGLEELAGQADEGPRVVAAGLLKAGKSTMLNCLTADLANTRFATGNVRTTVEEQECLHNGRVFVDTPGIDATGADLEVTTAALRRADLMLFVHNPSAGELDAVEMEFLEAQAAQWPSPGDFIAATVIVLTHLDRCGDDHRAVEERIREQMRARFNAVPPMVTVSSPRFLKGLRENKKALTRSSNYAALDELLEKLAPTDADAKRHCRRKRLGRIAAGMMAECNRFMALLDREREQRRKQHREAVARIAGLRDRAADDIAAAYQAYRKKL